MTKSSLPANLAVAAAVAVAAVDAAGAPVQRIKLLPYGAINLRDGRGPYRIADKAAGEKIVATTAASFGRADLPIDYDHALVYAAPRGERAPAAGWAPRLEAGDDGIYADVTWTAGAAAALEAREWRYISPVFTFDKGGNVVALHSAGLTNFPAITDLPAIAASATLETDMKKFAVALGLAEDANEDAILAAIAATKAAGADAVAAAAAKLGLAATATVGQVVAAALVAAEPDPKKFVSITEVKALTDQLATINAERADRVVAAAINNGKAIPAQRDRLIAHFLRDEVDFVAWEKTAPVIVAAGAMHLTDRTAFDGTAKTLTKDELAVCATMGLKPEEFATAKAKEA